MSERSELTAAWVKDGTGTAEPVTVETPVTEAAPAPAVEVPEAQPRDDMGRFLAGGTPAAPATEAATNGAAPVVQAAAAAPPPSGASATAVQEFIDAKLADGTAFQVPKGLTLPVKRGKEVEYEPLETVLSQRMMQRDYQIKTAEVAAGRRDFEAQQTSFRAQAARVEAREKFIAEKEAEMVAAQKDPDKWQAYQESLLQYQSNPRYRQMVDDALAMRETAAELNVYREQEKEAQVNQGVQHAVSWIEQMAPEFPGVNPERVRVVYAQALNNGQANLSPEHVREVFQREAQLVTEHQTPLLTQLAEMKAQLAALTAAKAAEAQNRQTSHALQRSKTPPLAVAGTPATGALAAPGKKFGPSDLQDRTSAWAKGG